MSCCVATGWWWLFLTESRLNFFIATDMQFHAKYTTELGLDLSTEVLKGVFTFNFLTKTQATKVQQAAKYGPQIWHVKNNHRHTAYFSIIFYLNHFSIHWNSLSTNFWVYLTERSSLEHQNSYKKILVVTSKMSCFSMSHFLWEFLPFFRKFGPGMPISSILDQRFFSHFIT